MHLAFYAIPDSLRRITNVLVQVREPGIIYEPTNEWWSPKKGFISIVPSLIHGFSTVYDEGSHERIGK